MRGWTTPTPVQKESGGPFQEPYKQEEPIYFHPFLTWVQEIISVPSQFE